MGVVLVLHRRTTTPRAGLMALPTLVLCVCILLLQTPVGVSAATSPPGDATTGTGTDAGVSTDVTVAVTEAEAETSPSQPPTIRPTSPPDRVESGWTPTPIDELLPRHGLLPLHRMVTWFLGAVQPRVITHIRHLFDFSSAGQTGENFKKDWPEVVKYAIGFAVCAGLGLFLLLFVPLTGSLIACCRCCNKCGGKVHPRDSQSSDCGRCCCGFLLFSLLAVMLSAGVLLVVLSTDINARLNGERSVFDDTAGHVRSLSTYTNSTLEELRAVTLERYRSTSGRVFGQLDGVIPKVQEEINATYHLEQLRALGESLTHMNSSASAAQESATEYTTQKDALSISLNGTRDNANSELGPCVNTNPTCQNAKDAMDGLVLDADFSNVDLNTFIAVVSEAVSKNISGIVSVAVEKYNKVFESANDTLKAETDKAKEKSVEVEDKINSFLQDIESNIKPSIFNDVADSILKAQTDLTDNKNYNYLSIPFTALLAIAVLVLLIVTCYFIGLLFGFAGSRFDPKHPSCCTWKAGACWLITGLVFSYIFYMFLMLILVLFFLSGGMAYTEVCRHLYDLPNSDARGFIDELVQANINGTNFTLSETYLDCARNKSLYVALKLEENGLNLTGIVNVDDINSAIDEVKKVNVSIGEISFLPDDVKTALEKLGEEMEAVAANVKVWIGQTNKEVLVGDLNNTADLLDAAANETNNPALSNRADELRQYNVQVEELIALKTTLAGDLNTLEQLTKQNVTAIVEGLVEVETKLNNTGSQMVKDVINTTADQVKGDIGVSVDQIQAEVRGDVGRCYPVYSALSGVVNTACVQTLYPVNAYWFCLGMVLIFMLPAILCAFKLVSLYRKTKPYAPFEPNEADLYMSAYDQSPDYRAYVGKDQQADMLLHRVDRPKAPDYIAMADNPVFVDDENIPVCNIPRVVLRSGRQVLPVQPAPPDSRYFYAMPSRYDERQTPPPRYTRSPNSSGV